MALLCAALLPAADAVSTVGTLLPRQHSVLKPLVSGRVVRVLAEVGDVVQAGAPLVELDAAELTSDRDAARAAAAVAAAQAAAADAVVTLAEKTLARLRILAEPGDGAAPRASQDEIDIAVARATQALAERDAAHAAAAQAAAQAAHAEHHLAEAVLRMPYNGTVVRRLCDPGTTLVAQPPDTAMEVADLAVLHLECAVPESVAPGLDLGAQVEVRLPGDDAPRRLPIALIWPLHDEGSRGLRIRILVPNPDGRYRAGALVPVTVGR